MTWIKIVPPEEAPAELAQVYESVYRLYPPEYGDPTPAVQRPDGTSDSIVAAHSLLPEAMWHAMSTFAALLQPGLPLSRRQQEMIATVVSVHNRCFY
jgi:hypothetical protein